MPASTTTKPVDVPALSISLARKDFVQALNIAGRGVASRASLPILTHVLIRQDGESGHVKFLGTDLDLWIEHALPQSAMTFGGPGGAATSPWKSTQAIASGLPEKPVSLTASGKDSPSRSLRLKCGGADYKLSALDADDFPLLPVLVPIATFRVEKDALKKSVRQTLPAVSTDQSRAILTGVKIMVDGMSLRLVATDTHRLVVRDCSVLNGETQEASCVVPDKAMQELLKLLDSTGAVEVSVTVANEQIAFRLDDEKTGAKTTLVSRLINGDFPNWERVVPKSHEMTVTLERDALLAALNRLKIVASEQASANRVALRFGADESDGLIAAAVSDNLGVAFERVECARAGSLSPFEIAFNIKYLIDALNTFDGDAIFLEASELLRPCVMRQDFDNDGYHVLMPMQSVPIPDQDQEGGAS